MGIRIQASDELLPFLEQQLSLNGFTADSDCHIHLVQKGYPIPEDGLALVFDENNLPYIEQLLGAIAYIENKPLDVVVGRIDDKYELLHTKEIESFEAFGNKVTATFNGHDYAVKYKLYVLEQRLADKGFIRVNKSMLINIKAIGEFIPWFAGKLLLRMKDRREIEVTKSYVGNFKRFIGM